MASLKCSVRRLTLLPYVNTQVLKADVGRVKFCLMVYLENKELNGISFRMHSVASNKMPNSGLNNESI